MNIIYTDNTLDFANLKRKPEVQAEYESLLKIIKNAGSTPQEVILNKLEGKKLAKVLNEFPYDLGEDLEHWLVWGVETEKYKMSANLEKMSQFGDKPDLCVFFLKGDLYFIPLGNVVAIFENTPSKKSVDLTHYHLIVRK